jgi:hypothetical protein
MNAQQQASIRRAQQLPFIVGGNELAMERV